MLLPTNWQKVISMQISKNFSLAELTKTQVRNVDNTPNQTQLNNIILLVKNVLQPLRDLIGKPINVNSCFRSEKVNTAIKGSKTSQHVSGEAVDLEVNTMSNYDLAKIIIANFKFDQIILEFASKDDPRAGWVHVSYKASGNRGQILTASTVKGKTVYTSGLPDWG